MKKVSKLLSCMLCLIMLFGISMPAFVLAEGTEDALTQATVLFEDHFNEAVSYEGWSNANGGEASRGQYDDGGNGVYRIVSKYTESSTNAADTVLQFTRTISGIFEMKFKVKMYSRGDSFKLLYRSKDAVWVNIFANNSENFESPVGTKISSITVDKSWHDFSVVFDTANRKYRVTRDAVVVNNGTIPDNFDYTDAMFRFQAYTSKSGHSVEAYIDDMYMIQHPDNEEYNGIAYENSFDATANEILAKGRSGWATAGDELNTASLALADYNGSTAIHSVAVRPAESAANADSTINLSGGAFFKGEWLIKADITPIRNTSRFAVAFREEDKSSNNWYPIFSYENGTATAVETSMYGFTFEAGNTYELKIYANLYDNTASVYVNDVLYAENAVFGYETYDTAKYSLRMQNITTAAGQEGEYYIDNVSIRYKDIPKIILNGNPVVRVAQGSEYTDAGASVIAEKYTVPENAVTSAGSIDTSVTGVQTITYNAAVDGKVAEPVTRKVIVESARRTYEISGLSESFDDVAYRSRGTLGNSWTNVNNDTTHYAYLGAVDKDGNRVLRAYTRRSNPESTANLESTVAKNDLNLSGLYKIDFDLHPTGENQYINVLLKDNTNNKNFMIIEVRGQTVNAFSNPTSVTMAPNNWYGISIIVDGDAGKVHAYIDGQLIGSAPLPDGYSLENISFRVQNWNDKSNAAVSYNFYADNFNIYSCTERLSAPEITFDEASAETAKASVILPDNYGTATAVLAVYEGNKLVDVDFEAVNVDGLSEDTITLEAANSTADNKRVSVIIVDGFASMRPMLEARADK